MENRRSESIGKDSRISAKKRKIMPRRLSLGADKVNEETGEPTFQKIYEPPRAP